MSALARDSDASGEPIPVREGDRFVEHATGAVLTVLDVIEHTGDAEVRLESEQPRRPVVRYRRERADVRERVGECWSRLDH